MGRHGGAHRLHPCGERSAWRPAQSRSWDTRCAARAHRAALLVATIATSCHGLWCSHNGASHWASAACRKLERQHVPSPRAHARPLTPKSRTSEFAAWVPRRGRSRLRLAARVQCLRSLPLLPQLMAIRRTPCFAAHASLRMAQLPAVLQRRSRSRSKWQRFDGRSASGNRAVRMLAMTLV